MMKTGGGDDFNFLTEENRISDEEIDGACDDIDLDSIASEQKDERELAGLTSTNRNRSDSDESASTDYNADIECDEDSARSRSSNYGIALDDDIVSKVLDGSDDRMKGRMNEKYKKVCKCGMLLLAGFVGFVWVLNSDFFVRRDIQQHGSAFHMDDENKFLEKPVFNVFDVPVAVSKNFVISSAYDNIVDVRGPAYQRAKETPFFVYSHDGSTVIEDIVSECLGMAIAGTNPIPSDASNKVSSTELHVWFSVPPIKPFLTSQLFTLPFGTSRSYRRTTLKNLGELTSMSTSLLMAESSKLARQALHHSRWWMLSSHLSSTSREMKSLIKSSKPVFSH